MYTQTQTNPYQFYQMSPEEAAYYQQAAQTAQNIVDGFSDQPPYGNPYQYQQPNQGYQAPFQQAQPNMGWQNTTQQNAFQNGCQQGWQAPPQGPQIPFQQPQFQQGQPYQQTQQGTQQARTFLGNFMDYLQNGGFQRDINDTSRKYNVPPKKLAENFLERVLGTIGDVLGIVISTVGNAAHTVVDILATLAHGAANVIVNVANGIASVFTGNKSCVCAQC